MRRTIEKLEKVYFNTLEDQLFDLFEVLENDIDESADDKIFNLSLGVAQSINILLEIDSDNYLQILELCEIDLIKTIDTMLNESGISISIHKYIIELINKNN